MSTAQHWLLTGSDDFEICAANSVISCSSNPTFLICVIMTLICGVIISAVMSCLLPVATWKRISIHIEWCVIYSGGGKLKIRWDILYKRYTLVTKVWCEFRNLDLVNEYGGPTLACCVPSYHFCILSDNEQWRFWALQLPKEVGSVRQSTRFKKGLRAVVQPPP